MGQADASASCREVILLKSPPNDKKGKGFAGLDSMVSDVSKDVNSAERPATVASKASGEAAANSSPTAGREPAPQDPTQAVPPPSGTSGKAAAGWAIGALVTLCLIIAVGSTGNKTSSTPSPTYSTPGTPSNPPATPAAPAATLDEVQSDIEKPRVGSDNVLNIKEIRYCQIQKVRMEAIEFILNNRNNGEIDRFNALVSDYNSRCGEFRYRGDDLQRIQQEVEQNRPVIANTAKAEWDEKFR